MWRTTAVTISTCFLLGTTFTHWIADHNVLWRSPLTADALDQSITYYSLLSSAPAGLGWVYVAVGIIAIASTGGRIVKGFSGENGEVLFDGGSLILLSAIAYNQISEVYPTISLFPSPLPLKIRDHPLYPGLGTAVRDLANDNVITAVMLTGVMLLQAGRYYSNRTSPTRATADSAPSSPPNELASQAASASLRKRVGTPYRELTEEEAMELSSLGGSVASNSKHQKR